MAEFSFEGLDEFVLSMQEVAELPEEVIDEILNAGADVAAEAQRREALKLGKLGGYRNPKQKKDWSLGDTARSIKKGRVKVKDGHRVIYITPTGSRKRGKTTTRNAEIAFVNEYGAPNRGIPARNWMQAANEKCAEATTAAQLAVYNKFLESKNL